MVKLQLFILKYLFFILSELFILYSCYSAVIILSYFTKGFWGRPWVFSMFEIDKMIIDQAKDCDRNFECLTDPDQPSCKVSECLNDNVHFLVELCRPCLYFLKWGFNDHICTCPVRKEIYNKYKK